MAKKKDVPDVPGVPEVNPLQQAITSGNVAQTAQLLAQNGFADISELQPQNPRFKADVLFEIAKTDPDQALALSKGDYFGRTGTSVSEIINATNNKNWLSYMFVDAFTGGGGTGKSKELIDAVIAKDPDILNSVGKLQMENGVLESDPALFSQYLIAIGAVLRNNFANLVKSDPKRYYRILESYKTQGAPQEEVKHLDDLMSRIERAYGKVVLGVPGIEEIPEAGKTFYTPSQSVQTLSVPMQEFKSSTDGLEYLLTGKLPPGFEQSSVMQGQDIEAKMEEAASRLPASMPQERKDDILRGMRSKLMEQAKKTVNKSQNYQVVKDQFDAIIQSGVISGIDLIKILKSLVGKVDADTEQMILGDKDWNLIELNILLNNMKNSLLTAKRFEGKIKPFNHEMHISTDPGFVHSTVPNPNGFSVYLTWKDLPPSIKDQEPKMLSVQKSDHAKGIKNVIGWVAITPHRQGIVETDAKTGEEKYITKDIWVIQELQSVMYGRVKDTGVENYFGDWYKMLYNYVIRLARAKGVDEIWVTPGSTVRKKWSSFPKNTADLLYDIPSKQLGATKKKTKFDLNYMGSKLEGGNKDFWVLPVAEISREKIAKRVDNVTRRQKVERKAIRLSNRK